MKAMKFSRLVALVLALAALAVTAGSAGATGGGDERSDKAKQEHSAQVQSEDKGDAEAKAAAKAEAEAAKKADAEARAAAKAQAEAAKKAEADARAAAKAQAKAQKKVEADARASAKAQAKAATTAAQVAAKAQAKAAAKAAHQAQVAAKAQAKAAAKAAHQAQVTAAAQAKAAAKAAAKTKVTTTTPPTQTPVSASVNQGDASKVLTVTGAPCVGTVVAGAKVEGGMGRTITLGSTLPIVKVTVKSGNGAAVVSSAFSADFKSVTITLSKDVSNYVVWTCGAAGTQTPTPPHQPGSGPNQGDSSKVLTVTGAPCVGTVVAGAKVEGKMGRTVTLTSTLPIVRVTLKSGNDAMVVSSSFSADFRSVTITLSKDVSNYVVWTCGAAGTHTQTPTQPHQPGSGPNQGDASKVLTVTGAPCPGAMVAGAKVEGKMGQTVTLTSTLPIVQVTLKSGNDATVVSSSFSADFKSVTITLSKDVSNYVVWTCGSATVQTTTTTGGDTKSETKPETKGGNETKPETKGANETKPETKGGNETKPEIKTEVAAETKTVTTTVKTTKAAVTTQPQGQPAGQAGETQPTSGDVLGATSAPEAIQETGESGTLPFTGIPLWIAALLGLGLLATGLVLRRAAHH